MHLQLKELNKNEKRYQIKNGKIVQSQVLFLPPSALIVHKLYLQIILMVLNKTSIVPAGSQAKNHCCGKLSVLVLNYQSIVSKKADLNCFIEATNPNIIIASETWLKPSINSSEFLPQHYIAYRNDREDGYGGVLLAHKYKITLT